MQPECSSSSTLIYKCVHQRTQSTTLYHLIIKALRYMHMAERRAHLNLCKIFVGNQTVDGL